MTFPQWKDYKKHCMFLKATFKIPLFLTTEVREQKAAFD